MSVAFEITLTCNEHPEYTGKRKNVHYNSFECGCYDIYEYSRLGYWKSDAILKVKIEEVRHNG